MDSDYKTVVKTLAENDIPSYLDRLIKQNIRENKDIRALVAFEEKTAFNLCSKCSDWRGFAAKYGSKRYILLALEDYDDFEGSLAFSILWAAFEMSEERLFFLLEILVDVEDKEQILRNCIGDIECVKEVAVKVSICSRRKLSSSRMQSSRSRLVFVGISSRRTRK